jgi:PHS family inorganic phosphate transporter-like MFS transporter
MDGRRSSGMIMAAASDSEESLQNPHGGVAYALDQRRRKALQEIDEAPFGWAHVKIVAVAGVGFMSDAYVVFREFSVTE